jgi:hypothetical protein
MSCGTMASSEVPAVDPRRQPVLRVAMIRGVAAARRAAMACPSGSLHDGVDLNGGWDGLPGRATDGITGDPS